MDYFKFGESRLYNGDCMIVMQSMIENGVKIDKVITSPPYNTTRKNLQDRGYDLYVDDLPNDKYVDWITNVFKLYENILNENGAVLFNMSYGSENTTVMLDAVHSIVHNTDFTLADILVWKKKQASPNNVSHNKMTRIVEFVFVFCRKSEFYTFTANKDVIGKRKNGQPIYDNVFKFFESPNNDYCQDLNKATFSTDFVQNLIDRYVDKDEIVMDNFSGTGTTLVSCLSNGIKCYAIELSKEQYLHTIERVSQGIPIKLL